ncbi:glycosyltransferase [Patulibacter minatonensis]|uniref:glycosyltransferase n=1 Tax=Patulibacter minatonensis TaxID=298163 RepID=UPI00146FB885|nr:glycosyltransferase [Patulibacter minatonensis]
MERLSVTVAIPTTGRPDSLDVALRSVLPQAQELGATVLVVDDGPSEATRAVAAAHGVRCLTHPRRRGLNASRNAAIDATDADLVCLLDDDVAVDDGWLRALVDAATTDPEVGALGGPVRLDLEGRPDTAAERRMPAISRLVLDPDVDQDTDRLWGANLAVRRTAVERIGPFDPTHTMSSGDEEEWLRRLRGAGGRIRYVAAAGVRHRRTGDDAGTAALSRAQYHRGRATRLADQRAGRAPGIAGELRTVAANLLGLARHRDAPHRWTTAHAAGRLREALLGYAPPPAPDGPWTPGIEDAFAGTSGHVAGRRAAVLRTHDRWLDLRLRAARTDRALERLAASTPRRRILVVVPARPKNAAIVDALREHLRSDRHDVELRIEDPAGRARFAVVEQAAAGAPDADWLLIVDDDVALPGGRVPWIDRFVGLLDAAGLDLAQPAHRRHGHAAWEVTRRVPGAVWRETTFVEIGPVTAISRRAADVLLPFPDGTGMGWGLDAHWAAVAADQGWRLGVVDALPVDHTLAPAGSGYDPEGARAAAGALLEDRPWIPRWEVRTVARHDAVPPPRATR